SAWLGANGIPLLDGRTRRERIQPGEVFAEDQKAIMRHALRLEGKVALAIQDLDRQGKLSPEHSAWRKKQKSKSRVNPHVRAFIQPKVKAMKPFAQGPRAVLDSMPSTPGHYNDVFAMDAMQGDDVTGNNYFWIEERGRIKAMRGEFLVASDV